MGVRMNIKEAARQVGLSEWSLRAGIKQGKYPYIKVGVGRGRIFVDIDMLEKALEHEAQDNQKRQAEIYAEYQREHNPEIVFMGDILSKNRA